MNRFKKIILEDIHESLIGYNGLMDLQCMDSVQFMLQGKAIDQNVFD
jgi:hypothetical protein